METFFALLALCAGNSPVSGEFPAQRPVKRSFYVFFDLHLIKRLSKHCWCFETICSKKYLCIMSNFQTRYHFKLDFQKVDQHTVGKWFIHGTR